MVFFFISLAAEKPRRRIVNMFSGRQVISSTSIAILIVLLHFLGQLVLHC